MAVNSPQIAAGPLADLGIVEEVSYGEIPPSPSLTVFRRRSTSLSLAKDAYESEETRKDRSSADSRHGIRSVGGDVITEPSPGAHGMAYEALLGGNWETPAAVTLGGGDEIAVVVNADATLTLTGSGTLNFKTAGLRFGDVISFTGTSDADYDALNFNVVGLNSAGTVATALAPALWAGSGSTLNAGSMVFVGAKARMGSIYRSFTFERAFTDIGSFVTMRGNTFNSLAVDLPATGLATATFSLIGKDADPVGSASIDGVVELVLDDTTLTALTFDAAAKTITASAGDFVAAGITVDDRVIFDGSGINVAQNRNPRTVVAVTASVLTVAEAIADGTASAPFTVTRVGLPDYTAAASEEVLAAASGRLVIDQQAIGVVTAFTINVDNQMAGSAVVGSNTIPKTLWGNRCNVGGTLTVLFDRDGPGELIYNAFDAETDVQLALQLTTSDDEFINFAFGRAKINSGSLGDAVAEGLPVEVEWRAHYPKDAQVDAGADLSQIVIQDSTLTGLAI